MNEWMSGWVDEWMSGMFRFVEFGRIIFYFQAQTNTTDNNHNLNNFLCPFERWWLDGGSRAEKKPSFVPSLFVVSPSELTTNWQ